MPGHGKLKIKSREGGYYVAVIGDEDTVTGFLLSGVETKQNEIETAFRNFTSREDIAVLLITQTTANEIRYLLNEYDRLIPTILEIPSKETPYDPEKDYILQRVKRMTGKQ